MRRNFEVMPQQIVAKLRRNTKKIRLGDEKKEIYCGLCLKIQGESIKSLLTFLVDCAKIDVAKLVPIWRGDGCAEIS